MTSQLGSHRLMLAVAVLVLLLGLPPPAEADENEYRLLEDLMKRYNRLERPVVNHTQAVVVKIGMVLQQIVEVDEKNQVMFVNAWIKYTWTDYKLKWDPLDYGGLADVRFPPENIWKPDILVYNSADSNFDSTYHSQVVAYSDGSMLWVPPGIIKTTCAINIKWFPFDDQQCHIKFGSWTYHGNQLDLQPENAENGIDTTEYLTNGEWQMLSGPVKRSTVTYECCPEPYVDVKFYVNIRRRTMYYAFNLILPSILISLMTILGFTLPPDAGEKITLEITILLSVCIFLSYLSNMIPQTSDSVPLLGTYFTCCMVVVSASVVSTVVVLNMHYRSPDTHHMGGTLRLVLLEWGPWLLMMKRPGHTFKAPGCFGDVEAKVLAPNIFESESLLRNVRKPFEGATSANQRPSTVYEQKGPGFLTVPMVQVNGATDTINNSNYPGGYRSSSASQTSKSILESFLNDKNLSTRRLTAAVADHRRETFDMEQKATNIVDPLLSNPGSVDPGVQALILMLQRIHGELKFVVNRMEKEDVDADLISDWKFAAMVIDRFCLIFYSVFMLCATVGIFWSAPNLFKA